MEAELHIGRTFGSLEIAGMAGWRPKGGQAMYKVICHTCKTDKELFGDGVFESSLSNLLSGQYPCGCAKSVYWSIEQQAVVAKRICKERGFHFVAMEANGRVPSRNKASVMCSEGHSWSAVLSNLKIRGCPRCARHGFKPALPNDLYVLRVTGQSGDGFCGYGITSELDVRLRTHKLELLKQELTIAEMEVFHFRDGETAKNTEAKIQTKFPLAKQTIAGFKKEATWYHLYDDVVAFVETEEAAKQGS